TTGDHRPAGARAHPAEQVQVGAGERAVAGDVGNHKAGTAVGVEPGERLAEVSPLPRPSAGGEPGPPHVEPDRDLLAAGGDDVPDPVRPFQRGSADVDAGAAGGQRGGERGVVADAAGQLDRDVEAADHAGDQFRVGAAAERGIQVD